MINLFWLIIISIGCVIFALPGISTTASNPFLYVTGPCNLKFPEDHGPHPGFRTEWWYYTGNVSDKDENEFGFQLTFFRSRTDDKSLEMTTWPDEVSAWRTRQLILAHAAVTDISGNRHCHDEQMARQAMDIAGATLKGDTAYVFIRNWSLSLGPQNHVFKADARDFSFEFTLVPLKKPVLHGDQGYFRKGRQVDSASCYYSFTRLKAQGKVRIGTNHYDVDGLAWMDHEFSTNPLEPDLVGWDWFSMQLDNHTELMAYFLRKKDGTFSDASSATFVTASGETIGLNLDDIHLKAIGTWKSSETDAIYPSRWHLQIPRLKLDLEIDPLVKNQEMRTPETTGVTYWEGCVSAKGVINGEAVSGKGYTELTGYAQPFDLPM